MRVVLSICLVLFSILATAQQALDKKIRSGIHFSRSSVNPSMQGTLFTTSKSSKLSIGYVLEKNFSNRFGLLTGLNIENSVLELVDNPEDDYDIIYFSSKIIYGGSGPYGESTVFTKEEFDLMHENNSKPFVLSSREQRSYFFSLPLLFEYKSRFFNFFRFTGLLGLRANFNFSSRSIDEVLESSWGDTYPWHGYTTTLKTKTRDVSNLILDFSTGTSFEWNFSSSKSMRIGFFYDVNINQFHKQNSGKQHLYPKIDAFLIGSVGTNPEAHELPDNNSIATTHKIRMNQFRISLFYLM